MFPVWKGVSKNRSLSEENFDGSGFRPDKSPGRISPIGSASSRSLSDLGPKLEARGISQVQALEQMQNTWVIMIPRSGYGLCLLRHLSLEDDHGQTAYQGDFGEGIGDRTD